MALVGSGTLKIQDHVTEGDFRAGSLDTSLAAIVCEVGGTYWQNGVPYTTPGNLDADNLAFGALPNAAKAQPYSLTALVLTNGRYPPYPASDPLNNYRYRTTYAVLVPHDLVAIEAVLAVNTTGNTLSVTGTAEVVVNGTKVGLIAGPGEVSGFAASRCALQGLSLRRGDVLTVDLSGFSVPAADPYAVTAGIYNLTVTVWCKALHV